MGKIQSAFENNSNLILGIEKERRIKEKEGDEMKKKLNKAISETPH